MANQLRWLNDSLQGPTFTKWTTKKNEITQTESRSNVYISLINGRLQEDKIHWELKSGVLATEHKLIEIVLESKGTEKKQSIRKIDYERTNWSEFFLVFDRLKPKFSETDQLESAIHKHDHAIERASKQLMHKNEKVSRKTPYFSEEPDELNRNIFRVRRSLTSRTLSGRKGRELRRKLKELNIAFEKELRIVRRLFMEKVHRANNQDEFWKI